MNPQPVSPRLNTRASWTPSYPPESEGTGRFLVPNQDTRTHEQREAQWPFGGMVTRPVDDRRWSIQSFTGYPVSNVDKGNWVRGQIIRKNQIFLHPTPLGLFAYDPTDPTTWHQSQH